jgi:hypothetical protein
MLSQNRGLNLGPPEDLQRATLARVENKVESFVILATCNHGNEQFFSAGYCSKSLQLTNLTSPDLFEVVSASIVVPRPKFH